MISGNCLLNSGKHNFLLFMEITTQGIKLSASTRKDNFLLLLPAKEAKPFPL